MKKKLPIGIQTFSDIRNPNENYAYIDKTGLAHLLITSCKYAFLSRPRRFGKSLFVDTLAEIFKGNKELFEGLEIYDKWDWNNTFPVINISFGSGSYTNDVLIEKEFIRIFRENNKIHGFDIPFTKLEDSKESFVLLIQACYEKYKKKVVILIDEYDKIILDNIHFEDKSMSLKGRNTLKNFYSALKDNDRYLHFVFLTGVSKFSKLNLFSGLNNIEDITIDAHYSTITGYTHDDLLNTFNEYLDGVDLNEVKLWYNGYNYFGEPIYNPFDILLFLSKGCLFSNYWWETGNPSFLIEILKRKSYYLPELENINVPKETLNAFDVEHIDLVALLWQTGYLTFDKRYAISGREYFKMKMPNKEITYSLNELFFNYLTDFRSGSGSYQFNIINALYEGDLAKIEKILFSLFAAIPYDNYVMKNMGTYEGYYASVMYSFMASLAYDIIPEDHTNYGRIDLTIKTQNNIYLFEFKVDASPEKAIQQIEQMKYYEKYQSENKDIYLIGIHFDSTKRNISEFAWKKINQ
ncbi:MAG: ATP-binding protein [Bacteroidales bacterium]|nr:ATP-binding protein [Bacteroidales bacterium]